MLSFIKSFGAAFYEAGFEPLSQVPDNPGRGWYRIYTYRIGNGESEEPVRYPGESLALVLFDVGAYRDRDLDEAAMGEIKTIMASFLRLQFDLIIRFCYDTEGKGMVREPSLFSQVKRHFTQIARMLVPYADAIYVYQGLLVGNWGEMHESKFLSAQCLQELISLFKRETEGKISLAIRKPVQYRMAFREAGQTGDSSGRIGFFNDGILGSETHLGTFAVASAGKGAWQEMWCPEAEISFLKPFLDRVPYGGEAVASSEEADPEKVIRTLTELRVSYLNSVHDEKLLSKWKQIPYGEENLYEYVGKRLGYCFLIRNVSMHTGKQWVCDMQVENIGFGGLYDEIQAVLWMMDESMEEPRRIGELEGSFMGMTHGEKRGLHLTFDRPKEWEQTKDKGVTLWISLHRKRDQRRIYFAQRAKDGKVLLGEVRKGR